jgi:hypothetical protein
MTMAMIDFFMVISDSSCDDVVGADGYSVRATDEKARGWRVRRLTAAGAPNLPARQLRFSSTTLPASHSLRGEKKRPHVCGRCHCTAAP